MRAPISALLLVLCGSASCLAPSEERAANGLGPTALALANGTSTLWGAYRSTKGDRQLRLSPCDLRLSDAGTWKIGWYWAWVTRPMAEQASNRARFSGIIEHEVRETFSNGGEATSFRDGYLFLADRDPREQRQTIRLTPLNHPEQASTSR